MPEDEAPQDNPDDGTDAFFEAMGVPEDLRAQMRHAHGQQEMTVQAERHGFFHTIESFNEEQLRLLRDMHRHYASLQEEDLRSLIGWYQGFLQGELQHRFHECPACFKDHDKELNDGPRSHGS